MAVEMDVIPGTLPEGECFANEQERLNAFAQTTQVFLPGTASVVNYGATIPSADNRVYPWYRLNVDGTPDRWYSYYNGAWCSLHSVPASSPESRFYRGSLASLDTYDGGSAGAVTTTTGPMWEVDADMEGRLPVGVSADFAYNATGGAKEVTLVPQQIPPLSISLAARDRIPDSASPSAIDFLPRIGATLQSGVVTYENPSQTAVSTIGPWKAGYFIKRTARAYYTV